MMPKINQGKDKNAYLFADLLSHISKLKGQIPITIICLVLFQFDHFANEGFVGVGGEVFDVTQGHVGGRKECLYTGSQAQLESALVEADNGARPDGFVQKPYNIADLAHQVREVLNHACLTAS